MFLLLGICIPWKWIGGYSINCVPRWSEESVGN